MKDWKNAIESLGFSRCCYEKLRHIHCMVFRKVAAVSVPPLDYSDYMYIPQDSHD